MTKGPTIVLGAAAVLILALVYLLARPASNEEALGPASSATPSGSVDAIPSQPERTPPLVPAPAKAVVFADHAESLDFFMRALADAHRASDLEGAEGARYALRQHFLESPPDVRSVLKSISDPLVRREIIPLYIDVHGGPTPSEMKQWLEGESAAVRAAACLRLARLGSAADETLLASMPAEGDDDVGSEALHWLLKQRGDEGFRTAESLARSKERLASETLAAWALEPGNPALVTALKAVLKEPLEFRLREAIADAVATTYPESLKATPGSQEDLFRRASDADVVTKALAFREAGNFMDQFKLAAPSDVEIERVRAFVRDSALRDPDPLIRRAAVLSRVGLSSNVKDLAGQCRAVLDLAGRDPDPGVRAAALRRVHRGSAKSGMPFGPTYLTSYVQSESDPDVRREALRTLPRWRGLGPQETEARALLAWSLEHDQDPSVRLEAAALMTELGYDQARPYLERAGLYDPDPRFRDALYEAVKEQVSAMDQALFETLRAASESRAKDVPAKETRGKGEPRIEPAYRALSERRGLPGPNELAATREIAAVPNRAPSAEVTAERHVRFTITPRDLPIKLSAELWMPAAANGTLTLIVPSDPLLGGSAPGLAPKLVDDAALALGSAVLTFDWRGRLASEGFSGRGDGEFEDFGAAMAAAESLLRGSAPIAPGVRFDSLRVVALGRGAEFTRKRSDLAGRVFEVNPHTGEPSTLYEAHARARTPELQAGSIEELRAWLSKP